MIAPYSTLGAAAIVLPTEDPNEAIVTASVISRNGQASDIGFDELDDDALTFAGQARVRTGFFGLTGHQLVGGGYSNKEFTSLDQRFGLLGNRQLASEDGSWVFYYNFDQYLYEIDKAAERGVGIFGRFGVSDGDANPMQYFISAGFGGTGMFASRPYDRFGIGYYWINIESPTLQTPLRTRSFLRDEHGLEVFYNIAITPWMLLTPDIQVIRGAQKEQFRSGKNIEVATVIGFRAQLVF
jgi:porin